MEERPQDCACKQSFCPGFPSTLSDIQYLYASIMQKWATKARNSHLCSAIMLNLKFALLLALIQGYQAPETPSFKKVKQYAPSAKPLNRIILF